MLKHRYKTKDEIPEAYRDLYTEKKGADGEPGMELTEVEGVKTQADIDRLRGSLQKEKEDHDKTRADLKAAQSSLGEHSDKIKALEADGKKSDKQEMVLENERLKRENESIKAQLENMTGELTGLKSVNQTNRVKEALRKAAKGMVRDDALDHVADQLADKFVISDGDILTKPDMGNKSGMEPKMFLEAVVKEQPWLVPQSKSGGAGGSGKGPGKGSGADDKPLEYEDMIPPIPGAK